jgi:hypothetical protein
MARPRTLEEDKPVIDGEVIEAAVPDGYLSLGEAPRDGKAIILFGRIIGGPDPRPVEEKGIWKNYSRRFDFSVNRFVDNSRWARFNAGGQPLTIAPIAWRHVRGFE